MMLGYEALCVSRSQYWWVFLEGVLKSHPGKKVSHVLSLGVKAGQHLKLPWFPLPLHPHSPPSQNSV